MTSPSVQVSIPHGGAGTHTLLIALEVDDDRLTDRTLADDVLAEIDGPVRTMLADERVRRQVDSQLADAGLTLDQLRDPKVRSGRIVDVRNDLALLLRREGWSLPRIGRLLNRHHTTVLYAIRQAEALAPDDTTADVPRNASCEDCDQEPMGGGRWCLRHFQQHIDDRDTA